MRENIILLLALITAATAVAQQKKEVRSKITYISGTNAYIAAGHLNHVSVGDTAHVMKSGSEIASIVISAIADSSSAARYDIQPPGFSVGDTVVIDVRYESARTIIDQAANRNRAPENNSVQSLNTPAVPIENVLTGRIAVQYEGVFAEASRFNISQPALLAQLRIQNLFGTGAAFSFYDRGFYAPTDNYALYANKNGFQQNMYDFSITSGADNSPLGFGFGRMSSRFVGGLGTFDGAQIFYRVGRFTAGIMGGAAANLPSSVLDFSGTKTAAFLNYRNSNDVFHQYDGTIAYGVQLVGGRLDRNFIYLQNQLGLGSDLSVYETSEIDMSDLTNGARQAAFNFSNTFLSINYSPEEWIFINAGYDASREIYLFQTMRNIPDSLLDRNILQGFRGSATAELSETYTISANASFRTEKGFARNERTLGGNLRGRDLFETGLNSSLQYTDFVGAFSNGADFSFELDRSFFYTLALTLRYDSYKVSVSTLQQTYSTQTLSGYIDYFISPRWYSSVGVDDVIDATMNSVQLHAEVGIRF